MDTLLPFRHKPVLFLLLIPALLLLWTFNRRGRGVAMPFDHGVNARGTWLRALLSLAEAVPALLLALVVLILAGPQRWDEPQTRRMLTNIEFCVDVSGSMTAKFEDGDRYDASMRAINDFLDYRTGDAFGLTFFGNSVLHWVPLTSDVSAFRCAPPFMRPQNLPYWFGGTEIGRALLACRKILTAREQGDRMIILVTDGYSSDLANGRDEEIARQLRDDQIVVYAVHVADGEPSDQLTHLASITGGEVFSPGDQQGLAHVFQRIDEMQKSRIEKTRTEAIDDYPPWCRAGLVLVGVALIALLGLRYTPW